MLVSPLRVYFKFFKYFKINICMSILDTWVFGGLEIKTCFPNLKKNFGYVFHSLDERNQQCGTCQLQLNTRKSLLLPSTTS